jgi:WD40 repeat protein
VPFLDAVAGSAGEIVAVDQRGVRVDGRRTLSAPAPLLVAALSRDGRFAVGASGRSATVWRTADGVTVATMGLPTSIRSAAVSGTHVVLGGADGAARVRRVGGGPFTLLRGHARLVTAVGLSANASRVATGDGAGVVRVWRIAGGTPEHVLRGHRDLVTGAAFSVDGRRLATSSRDRDARTWDVGSGLLLRTLVGHFAIVSEASFSKDSRWVVTAGPGTAGLWLRGAGPPGYLRGHTDKVTSASFAPDDVTVVTASRDGTVRTYRCDPCRDLGGLIALARGRLSQTGRSLSAAERRRFLRDD